MPDKLIAGVIGLFTGAVGSLITPWVKWGIEKRRSKLEYRKRSIAVWREEGSHGHLQDFLYTPGYAALAPLLNPRIREEIESAGGSTYDLAGPNRQPTKENLLMDEIARIEREWNLL